MKTNIAKNIGTVSHATMREEDLIPTFLDELESQRPLSREHRKLVREIKRRMNKQCDTEMLRCSACKEEFDHDSISPNLIFCPYCGVQTTEDTECTQEAFDYFGSEDATYDLEALFDALEAYCLPYFYFGAHPGDGSDYGYWLPEDFQDEFDGLKVSDLSEIPTGYTGEVLHVNDHGNMTLYVYTRGKHRELWAIV